MSERTDSTFDLEGEAAWDIADKCEQAREQWAHDALETARTNTDYGELFRRALVVQEKMRWCASELEELSVKAECFHHYEVEANKELVPDELPDYYRADFVSEAGESRNTVFPDDTGADLKSLSDDLGDLLSTETFDSLQHLAALWDAHWARRHDVNEPVTK